MQLCSFKKDKNLLRNEIQTFNLIKILAPKMKRLIQRLSHEVLPNRSKIAKKLTAAEQGLA